MPRLELLIGMLSLTVCSYATVTPDTVETMETATQLHNMTKTPVNEIKTVETTTQVHVSRTPVNEMRCARPKDKENAFLQNDQNEETHPHGHILYYGCHPGYTLSRKIRIICLGGKWVTLSNGYCKKKQCGHPGDIPFGSFELIDGNEFVFGAVVEYSCEDGYQIVSKQKTRLCSADGWTNQSPHCEARLCPPVNDDSLIVQTTVTDDEYTMGHVIHLKCRDPKQTLKGPPTIYCTADGTWNKDPPTCKVPCTVQMDDMRRNNVQLKNNGKLHFEDKEDVQFECVFGYNISNPAKLLIQCNNGNLTYPTCNRTEPCTVQVNDMKRNNIQLKNYGKLNYKDKEHVHFECVSGYNISDPAKLLIQCNNGKLTYPTCNKTGVVDMQLTNARQNHLAKTPCGRPPYVTNGEIASQLRDSYPSGSSVKYQCSNQFKLHGSKVIRCQNGRWDQPPVCLVKTPCGQPPKIKYGEIISGWKDSYPSGSSVRYQCPRLYNLHGANHVRCQDGRWSQPPLCLEPCTASEENMKRNNIVLIWKPKIKFCVRDDQKGRMAKKCFVKHSETITFQCLPGYKASHSLTVTCDRGTLAYPTCTKAI